MASSADALDARLAEGLAALGKASFRPGQEEAVRTALQKLDSLVVLPTGGGKSLCYTLPALVQSGVCVVVSPLRALMKDQVDSMRAVLPDGGVTSLTSLTTDAERKHVYAQLDGAAPLKLKCLLVAPEQLESRPDLVQALARLAARGQLSLVAIDEAHCVADWGSSFRKAYLKLHTWIDGWTPRPPVMALTATASAQCRADITRALRLRQPRLVMSSFDRKNIYYEVRYPDAWPEEHVSQDGDLVALLREPDALGGALRCGIVYCRSKDECHRVKVMLCAAGIKAAEYHRKISDSGREAAQAEWMDGRVTVIVATVAFGMGIDKADVRLVVHMQPPMTMTGWYQESGRAGRDGQPARSVVYYTAAEEAKQTYLSQQPPKDKTEAEAKKVVRAACRASRAVKEAVRTPSCLRGKLVLHFGETLPRGACTAPGSAGCAVCSNRRMVEASIAALASAAAGDRDALRKLHTAIAKGNAGVRDLDFEGYNFGLSSDKEEDSDEEDGRASGDDEDPDAARAADVALAAGAAAGGDAEKRCGLAIDALEEAEEEAEAAQRGSGRTGLAAALFGHRRPAQAAAERTVDAAAARTVDAVLRGEMRKKLADALRGDAAAAAESEAQVFARCGGSRSRYERAAREVVLDAQRAASCSAAQPQQAGAVRAPLALAPSSGQRTFVPPRFVPPPQSAEAQPPKLKSTRIGPPLPSEEWQASKQQKTS